MSGQHELLTILFCDISNSSRLYREKGDEEASRTIRRFLGQIGELIRRHGGTVHERIGDELMCFFPEVLAAFRCSAEIQAAISAEDAGSDDVGQMDRLAVRIGLHCGEVVRAEDGLFGDTIYAAKRLTDLAKAYQVLFSRETLERLTEPDAIDYRFVDTMPLKGVTRAAQVYELVADELASTIALSQVAVAVEEPAVTALELSGTHGSLLIRSGDRVTLGRSDLCDLRVTARGISKVHARLEGKKGFVLTDASTNGTFVRLVGAERAHHLHRDEMRLTADGLIGLALEPAPDTEHTLAFRLLTGEVPPCSQDSNSSKDSPKKTSNGS